MAEITIPETRRIPQDRIAEVCDQLKAYFKEKCEKKDISFEMGDIVGIWSFLSASPSYFLFRVEERGGALVGKLTCHRRNARAVRNFIKKHNSQNPDIAYGILFKAVRLKDKQTVRNYLIQNTAGDFKICFEEDRDEDLGEWF